jgi:hypothetical protein
LFREYKEALRLQRMGPKTGGNGMSAPDGPMTSNGSSYGQPQGSAPAEQMGPSWQSQQQAQQQQPSKNAIYGYVNVSDEWRACTVRVVRNYQITTKKSSNE